MAQISIYKHLREIDFIGPFPQGILVLLVPFKTALEESREIEPNVTENQLRDIFKKNNIFVFNTLEDYQKFKIISK